MPRRSTRLQTTGYYNCQGTPKISYRETICRVFRRRRHFSESPSRQSSSSTSSYNSNADSNSSYVSTKSKTSRRDRNSNDSSNADSDIRGSDINRLNSNNNDDNNGYSNRCSNRNNRSDSKRRGRTVFCLKIFAFLFFILPLCFGFAYLSSKILDSRPSDSPAISDTDFNARGEDIMKHMRELQDELFRLKAKLNTLLPDADTMPNFALDSHGARVLFPRSSKTYQTQDVGLTLFGIPIWQSPVSPKVVIQGHSPLVPGCCWAFAGGRGHLSIALSHPITISHVTLGHISKNLSPTGTITSAPRQFSVYGMKTLDDEGTHLGTFLYNQDGESVQTFKIPDHKQGVINFVKLQVESNWGHPDYSCLYNFRVHGKLAD